MPRRYRVFFNRALEWPQCWSIDEGDQTTALHVVGFRIEGCLALAHTLPNNASVNRRDTPSAWLEVVGVLALQRGVAVFTPA